jgi:phosphotriesterase-related protein
MSHIMTVNGPINPGQLGFTSMHEHILYDGRVFRRRFEHVLAGIGRGHEEIPLCLENSGQIKHGFIMCPDAIVMEDEKIMAAELTDFKGEGGSAVVDMSTPGLRVDPLKTRRVSEESGVHIVATTGFYSQDSWPERFMGMGVSDMEAHMMDEIENGIENTGVRPGHVKVAIEGDFPEGEANALRAGARVARRTGFSMTVHQGMLLGPDAGDKIADIIESEKLDAHRVVIAHNDRNFVEHDIKKLILDPDSRQLTLAHATALLDRGYNISVDCFGHYWDAEIMGVCAMPDWQRLAGLVELLAGGYAGQIVLGTDTFVKILLKRFGGEGYCRLTSFVVPSLRSVNVPEPDIRRITVQNPASILAY